MKKKRINFKDYINYSLFAKSLISVLIALVLVYLIWFLFFSYSPCNDLDCFNDRLSKCQRTIFVGGEKNVFEYKIKGPSKEFCEVDVFLVKGELSFSQARTLEGLEMTCFLLGGVVVRPESDLRSCSGPLKEEIQYLMIEKLHTYISDNLGRINLEIVDIPSF